MCCYDPRPREIIEEGGRGGGGDKGGGLKYQPSGYKDKEVK